MGLETNDVVAPQPQEPEPVTNLASQLCEISVLNSELCFFNITKLKGA